MTRLNLSAEDINAMFPICGVTVYKHHLVVTRYSKVPKPLSLVRRKRGVVQRLSRRSLFRFLCLTAEHQNSFLSMLTLSYGVDYPLNGKEVKKHLNAFFVGAKRLIGQFVYAWFLEFQGRGAPHFHILLSVAAPDKEDTIRGRVADVWARISTPENRPYSRVGYNEGRIVYVDNQHTQEAVKRQHRRLQNWSGLRSRDGAVRYVAKYVGKSSQKSVPPYYRDVGRYWGLSNSLKLGDSRYFYTDEVGLREFLMTAGRDFSSMDVIPKHIVLSNSLPELSDLTFGNGVV